MNKKINGFLISLSFQERRKKKLEKYISEMKVLEYKETNEINMDYIELKTLFEHKKRVFSVFVIAIMLSIFMNIWSITYELMLNAIKYLYAGQGTEELAYIAFLICIILLVSIALVFLIGLYLYLHDFKKINKKLMMIEQIKLEKEGTYKVEEMKKSI